MLGNNGAQLPPGLTAFPAGTTIQSTGQTGGGMGQQTVLMTTGGSNGTTAGYYLAPAPPPPQPQFKIAFGADGNVFLQPVNPFPQTATGLSSTMGGQTIKLGDSITLKDGSGSSQPSPDSTTPTLDSLLPCANGMIGSSLALSTPTITFSTSTPGIGGGSGKFIEGSAIKLTDSISLTIQNSTPSNVLDERRAFGSLQNNNMTTVTPVGVKPETKRGKTKREPRKTARKGTAASNAQLQQQQQQQQQLITIPIQTNLGSTTITPVLSNTPTTASGMQSAAAVIQIGDHSGSLKGSMNGSLKKIEPNSTGNMILLKSTGSTLSATTSAAAATAVAGVGSGEMENHQNPFPVVQISLNNKEFCERLETQIKTLSQVKTPSAQQKTLLQELVSLQKTMQDAKQQSGDGGCNKDTKIILTSQPLMSSSSTSTMGGCVGSNSSLAPSVPTEITIQSKPSSASSSSSGSANTQLLTPIKPLKESMPSNTQIITITSKPLDSCAAGSTQTKSDPLGPGQPTQLIIQSSGPTIKNECTTLNGNVDPLANESNNFKLLAGNNHNTSCGSIGGNNNLIYAASQGTTFQVGNQIITITTPSSSQSVSNLSLKVSFFFILCKFNHKINFFSFLLIRSRRSMMSANRYSKRVYGCQPERLSKD